MPSLTRRPEGLADVVAEVQHQQRRWGLIHDRTYHNNGALLKAAKAMLLGKGAMPGDDWTPPSSLCRRDQLVRAAALIISEINRIDSEC